MREAFYRRYRPISLETVVGQEHITGILNKALASGSIRHAYLFTGPKGVGKTSVARILAHQVNGLPYEEGTTHLDIIEIDAASNRRIDEIRELRDKVHIAPTSAKYKVYIIDEVHMLTREAFNALLKTLEEPPEHVIFILATTEVHKVPDTIASRTQRFTFRMVNEQAVAKHLGMIAKKEKITIDDEALLLIARYGGGSFRDSISVLDQLSSAGEALTVPVVESILGIPSQAHTDSLIEAVMTGDSLKLLAATEELRVLGISGASAAKQLAARLRDSLTTGTSGLPKDTSLRLLKEFLLVANYPDQLAGLEVILLSEIITETPATPAISPPEIKTTAPQKNEKPAEKPTITLEAAETKSEQKSTVTPKPLSNPTDNWNDVLLLAKKTHNTLYGMLRLADVQQSDANKVTLGYGFSFHVKQLKNAKNTQLLQALVKVVYSAPPEIEIVLLENAPIPEMADLPPISNEQPVAARDESVSAISNIFGGAELLES